MYQHFYELVSSFLGIINIFLQDDISFLPSRRRNKNYHPLCEEKNLGSVFGVHQYKASGISNVLQGYIMVRRVNHKLTVYDSD